MTGGARRSGRLFVEIVDHGVMSREASSSFVFVHGLGGTHRYWTAGQGRSLLPAGSVLVDLYGFGRSPRPFIRYTLDRHLAALDEVFPEGPFTLVGHSLGAALALAYAARNPDRVRRLVLISLPVYGSREAAVRFLRRRPQGWFFTNMVLTAVTCVVTRRALGRLLPRLLRDLPSEVARDLVEHNLMSSTTSLWNVLYRSDLAAEADRLAKDLEVAFIHGTGDTTAPIGSVRALAAGRERWELFELEGVDHHPWLRHALHCSSLITVTRRSRKGGAPRPGSQAKPLDIPADWKGYDPH